MDDEQSNENEEMPQASSEDDSPETDSPGEATPEEPKEVPGSSSENPMSSGMAALAAVASKVFRAPLQEEPLEKSLPAPLRPKSAHGLDAPPSKKPLLPKPASTPVKSGQARPLAPPETASSPKSLSCPPQNGSPMNTDPVVSSPLNVHPRKSGAPMKRPADTNISPVKKKPKVESREGGLPYVPVQPKLKPTTPIKTEEASPKAREESSPLEVEKIERKHSMDVFPGGRGVPSPTIGIMQRYAPSPLALMSFSSKLGINRNPFRTRSHRPGEACNWRKGTPLPNAETPLPAVLSSPIVVHVSKPITEGLFDSAEGDAVAAKVTKKPTKIKKKKFIHIYDRLPLDQMNFSSPKDTSTAKKLLAGIHHVGAIIPKKESMWLGKNLWVFTVEQLDYSLSAPSKKAGGNAGQDLMQAVARGLLVRGNEASCAETKHSETKTAVVSSAITVKLENSDQATGTSDVAMPDAGASSSVSGPLGGGLERSAPTVKQIADKSGTGSNPSAPEQGKNNKESSFQSPGQADDSKPLGGEMSSSATAEVAADKLGTGNNPTSPKQGIPDKGSRQESASEQADSKSPGNAVSRANTVEVAAEKSVPASKPSLSAAPGQGPDNNESTSKIPQGQTGSDSVEPKEPEKKSIQEQLDAEKEVAKARVDETHGKSKGDASVEVKSKAPSVPPRQKEPSAEQLQQAYAIIQRWRGCVGRFKSSQMDKKGATTFLLSGPIGQLLPKLVRQFMESVRVKTLMGFFSLKKTEASPLIAYYKDWRKHCELPLLKGYCLARHLLGMNIRLEKAVRSMPPADAETRRWMSKVLVILTGSSKDFIVDECKIVDVEYFLNERTKEWSDRLVLWRTRNNLPPLKGSGKVAMVSGWKTSLKDSMDVEKGRGRVLTEAELLQVPPKGPDEEEGEAEETEPEQETTKKKVSKKSKAIKPVMYTSGQSALHSGAFLASVLRGENVKFLNSINIFNSEQLIECDKQPKSSAILELMKFRTEATNVQAQPATCVRLMYDWTQRIKTKLEEIQSDTVTSLAKKRGPKAKESGETQSHITVVTPKKQPANV